MYRHMMKEPIASITSIAAKMNISVGNHAGIESLVKRLGCSTSKLKEFNIKIVCRNESISPKNLLNTFSKKLKQPLVDIFNYF